MALPVNTFDSYSINGFLQDIEDRIYDISPEDTPFMTKTGKTKVTNKYHEWQTDALRAAADNAHIEGDDTIADAMTPTVTLGNYQQIFKNAVSVPGSDKYMTKAGRGAEIVRQTARIMAAQKLDQEKALFANQARSAGASGVTPRRLAGMPAWLTTNTDFQTGSSGADPTGDGTNARTDDGTPTAFTQTKFNTVMESIFNAGGKPDTVYLSSFQMKAALGFVGNNNQRSNVQARAGEVINNIIMYETPFGKVDFIMSRLCRSRDVFIVQSDMWSIGVGRPMFSEELAKLGDSDRRQVITELTLVSKNEKASGGVFDNTTS